MPSLQNRPALLFKHTSVVVMYLLFLFVQVFFNFDTGRHQYDARVAAQHHLHTAHYYPGQKHFKTDSGHSLTTKSRLNKRFQPSVAPAIDPFVTAPVICYTAILNIGCDTDEEYVSFHSIAHSLRGPPVGALRA